MFVDLAFSLTVESQECILRVGIYTEVGTCEHALCAGGIV